MDEMESNLQINVLLPDYIPKQIIFEGADGNNQYASICYATYKRKKQTGYTIKLGKYELYETNGYEGKFINFYVECRLKKTNSHEFSDKVLAENDEIIQGVAINQALIEREKYNGGKNYWYKFTFEYDGYEYHVMSNIYGYYTEELLQEIKRELLRSVEDMLNK